MGKIFMNKIGLALFSAALLNAPVNAEGMPSLVLSEGDDLESVISDYALDLDYFLDSQGASYTITYGVGSVQESNKNSGQYINSVNLAYKQALLRAYAEMASILDPDGVQIATKDGMAYQSNEGDAIRDALIESCRSEAEVAFKSYQAKKRKEEEEKNSLLGLAKEGVRQTIGSDSEQPARVDEPDFIHKCVANGDAYVQTSSVTKSLSDSVNGGRIWATVYHESEPGQGKIGVVLAKSNETSEVASILKEQLKPSSILESASMEIRDRVKSEVQQFPEFPYGLVGTRMMKLSNGEWALYAFGAVQDTSGAKSGFMGNLKSDMAKDGAEAQSEAELSRFSGMMVNADFSNLQVGAVQEKLNVEINLTQGTEKVTIGNPDQTLGSIMNAAWEGSSELTLTGAREVFSRKFKDESGLAFRLVATAWSPSLMAKNLNRSADYDAAAENAIRDGKYQVSSDKSEGKPKAGKTQVIITNQDW